MQILIIYVTDETVTSLVEGCFALRPRLQAPHISKRQLLSSKKDPNGGSKRRGYPQEKEDGRIKKKLYLNVKTVEHFLHKISP